MSAACTHQMTWREWLLSERPQSRAQARLGRAYMTWRRFTGNKLAVVGLAIILALVVVATLADQLAPYSPITGDLRTMRLLPPSAAHWMGTDEQGRDILSRVIYGSRLTLYIIILVAIFYSQPGLGKSLGCWGRIISSKRSPSATTQRWRPRHRSRARATIGRSIRQLRRI